jgi:hypothetical protein
MRLFFSLSIEICIIMLCKWASLSIGGFVRETWREAPLPGTLTDTGGSGNGRTASSLGTPRYMSRLWKGSTSLSVSLCMYIGEPVGQAPSLKTSTDTYMKALEMEHLSLQRLRKGTWRQFCEVGLGQYVYWAGTCTGFIYFFRYVQLKGIVGLLGGHNTLKIYLHAT